MQTGPNGKRQLYARPGSPLTQGIGQEVYDAAISQWDARAAGGQMTQTRAPRGGSLESQLPPEQQGQEFGLPPGGPDTLRGKFAAFMGSPIGKIAQAAPMALTGGVVGFGLGGPVGGLIGGALGAVGGVALPEYQQSEVARLAASYGLAEAQRKFDEENVVGQALHWLDFARGGLEQAVGTAAQIGGAALAPERYGTLGEVVQNFGATLKAARLTYEAAPIGLSGIRQDEHVWVDYDLPETNGGLLPLVEARQRIAAGEDPTAVHDEIAARFGAPGQLRELASGLVADPLILSNVFETRALGLAGRALGDASLIEAAARTAEHPGLFATAEAYKNLLLTKPLREGLEVGRELTTLQKFVIGKELLNLADKGTYTPPKWYELGRLTPESAARETVFKAHDMLGTLVAQIPNDEAMPAAIEKLIGSFKHADLEALPKDFPEAARLGLSVEGRVVRRSINEAAVLDKTQAYAATVAERQLLGDLAAVAGDTPEGVLKRIAGGETEALLKELRTKAEAQGPQGAQLIESLDKGALDAKVLSEMAKTFGEDGVPYSPEMLKAAVMESLIEASGGWAARTFGVKSADWVTRFAQAVKGVESVALLGLNISYPIRNFWNGEATVIVDGVWGLRGVADITQEWERLGVLPARAMAGTGMADISSDISSTAIGARAVRAGLTPIEKATETTGILTEIRNFTKQIGDKLPPTHVAQKLEQWQGTRAFYEGFRQMWSQLRQKDATIPRLPQSVEQGLRAADPRLPDYLYAAARAGYNPAEITAAVMAEAPPVILHQYYAAAGAAVGISDGDVARLMALDGVGDHLNDQLAKLGPKAKANDVARIFDQTRRSAEKAITAQIQAETANLTERAAAIPGVEGALGVMNVTDDIELDLLDTFTRHAQNLDKRWTEIYREGKPKSATVKAMFAEADQVWSGYQAREEAAYAGLAEGMGRAKMGLAPEFLPAVKGKQTAIRAFNDAKNELLRTFFSTEHAPGTRSAAWEATTKAIDGAYFDLAQDLNARQTAMDDYLVAAYRARSGDAVADGVQAWRDAVRQFNQEDMARVREFRQRVRTLPDSQQPKAWTDFHNERLQQRWQATQALINVRRGLGGQAPAAVPPPPSIGPARGPAPTAPTPPTDLTPTGVSADTANAPPVVPPAPVGAPEVISPASGGMSAEVAAAQQHVVAELELEAATAELKDSLTPTGGPMPGQGAAPVRTLDFEQPLTGGRVWSDKLVVEGAEVIADYPNAVKVRLADGHEETITRDLLTSAEAPAGGRLKPEAAPPEPTGGLTPDEQAILNAQREKAGPLLKQARAMQRKANKLYRKLYLEANPDPEGALLAEMNRLRGEAATLTRRAQITPGTRQQVYDLFLELTQGNHDQADAGMVLLEARAQAAGKSLTDYIGARFSADEPPIIAGVTPEGHLFQTEGPQYQLIHEQTPTSDAWRILDAKTKRETNSVAYATRAEAEQQVTRFLEGQRLFQGPKGAVRFLEDGRAVMKALEAPDVSTLAHELGHVFRRDLGGADLKVAEDWAGVVDGVWAREHEEKFARGFERYLADGHAPTAGLAHVFAQFKEWLIAIYQHVTGSAIDVQLSPEMRAVFDRLLAENPEIAKRVEPVMPKGVIFRDINRQLIEQPGGKWAFQLPDGQHARLLGTDAKGDPVIRAMESGEARVVAKSATGAQTAHLPPGMLDHLTGGGPMPHAQAREAAWYDRLLPVLDELQKNVEQHVAQGAVRGHAGLAPELQAGVRDWLGQVNSQMADAKLQSIKWGQFKRDAALLNYSRRYQFNNFLGLAFPYEFWMTHSMMQWAMRAIDKPALLANYYRLSKFMATEVTKPGFPSRLAGRVKIPLPFLPAWMGGGMFVDPQSAIALPISQFFAPWEQLQQQTTQLNTRATRKLEELAANGQISQADAARSQATQSGPAWARALQLAKSDEDQQQFDGVDFASLIVSPHLPLQWAYNLARGTPEQIQPLPGTRQLKALTVAMGIGPAGGVNIEAGLRRHFGLPLFDQWEDYRIDRELANMAGEGLTTPEQARAAMIERSGPLFEQAQQRAGRVGGFGTITNMIFGTSAGIFPEGEQRQRLLGALIGAAHQAQDNGDPDALAKFFEAHPEYEARLALYQKPDERIKNFLVDQVWNGYNNLPELYKAEVRAQFGATFSDAFMNPDTRSYDSIPPDTLAAWARTLGRYVPLNLEGAPIDLQLSPPQVAMEAQQYYALRKQFFGDPVITALQSAYFQIPQHARATDKPMPGAVDDYYAQKDQLFPDNGKLWDLYHNLPENMFSQEAEAQFPNIGAKWDAYHALPASSKERRAYWKANPDLGQYMDWAEAWKAAHPEAKLRAQFMEQFPPLKQQLTWQEAFYHAHPEVKAYLDLTDVSARDAFIQAHPELKQYWEFRRGWLDGHPVSAPYITEKSPAQTTQPEPGQPQPAQDQPQAEGSQILASPEMQTLVMAHLFAGVPLEGAAYRILRDEFVRQGGQAGTDKRGRGNLDAWLINVVAFGGNLGQESYSYNGGAQGAFWPSVASSRAPAAASGGRSPAAAPGGNLAASGNNIAPPIGGLAPNPYATTAQPSTGSGGGAMQWADMAAQQGAQYGVPPEFILTLIRAESGGNPNAVGDGGHSVGLFQLHDRGVGYGYSVEQRQDPALQFQLMMPRIAAAYTSGVAQGLSGRDLAMWIGKEAERPAAAAVPRYGVNYDAITGGR